VRNVCYEATLFLSVLNLPISRRGAGEMSLRELAATTVTPMSHNNAERNYVVAWLPHCAAHSGMLTGWTGIVSSDQGITRLVLPKPSLEDVLEQLRPSPALHLAWTPLLVRAHSQICAYLAGRRQPFTIPTDLRYATPFAAEALRHAQQIPWGHTSSYGDLAKAVGRPRAARAVGQAMAANPMPLLIPCHRVVGTDGSLTGFGGGLEQKRALLRLEGVRVDAHRE
jgi:methylated-DNA-[protein]-cysteine S-methyltransferase